MPFVPARPSALNQLSSAVASAVLSKHFGDIVKAAKELNVDRKDLQQLVRHNPRILNAAHERMELFRIGVKSKIIEAVLSKDHKKQRWGVDAVYESCEFRDLRSEVALLSPAPRPGARGAETDYGWLALEREATAELAREAAAELAREREAEVGGDRRREREGEEPARALDWRDVDLVSEEPAPSLVEPALVESELPLWLGDYPPPPLVANRYQPWALLPRRECKHEQEPRRRPSRAGWR
jgi:hypothetical protein